MAAMAIRCSLPGRLRHSGKLLLVAWLCVFTSCFSFRVTVPPDPECVVATLAILHAEPAADDLEKPIVDEPVASGDASIFALIKVLQVSKPLTLQWNWYSPDNKLIRRSKSVKINAKEKYLAYFAAWDTLVGSYYSEKKGNWLVVITANGSFLTQKEFTIN
jgi:hypothetical protein